MVICGGEPYGDGILENMIMVLWKHDKYDDLNLIMHRKPKPMLGLLDMLALYFYTTNMSIGGRCGQYETRTENLAYR